MLLSLIIAVFLCVCSSQGWHVDLSGRYPGHPGQHPRPGVVEKPQCFGLARRTRQQKINVPLIYNSRTGQSLPFPKFLYTADRSVISQAEKDGWEVEVKHVFVPRPVYERVPVCCPWEQNCDAGRQIITSPAAENPGKCANGGQMIYRDGQQRCECPPGYQGMWCQLRVLPGEHQAKAIFPSGPLIRMIPAPAPYGNMVREADIWRSKAKQLQASQMPSAKIHLPAVVPPWSYGAAVAVQRQMMQARMAAMQEQFMKPHGDFNSPMPQQTLTPPDVRKNAMMLNRNPYSVDYSRADGKFLPLSEDNTNPYSMISSQGQLPPGMMRAFYAVQEELKHKQNLNPYSRASPDLPKPLSVGLLQRGNGEQADMNPYNTQPPQGRDVPQARTPWDLDPFGQQQNPSYMNYPEMPAPPNRNKQALAIMLYQQLMNQHKGKLSARNDTPKRPTVLSVGVQTPAVVPQVNIGTQQQSLLSSPPEGSVQAQQVTNIPETTSSNINEQQRIPMNGQPFAPMPGPNPLYQQQAGPGEMKRIEQCQAVLTPRLSECLKDYGLVMEQFMNPEYMHKARAVCLASQTVGQCIMQHDQACGQGDAVMTTRTMINSVLHMMGMICQQIAARGYAPIMPGQGQQDIMPGQGQQNIMPGQGQQNIMPGQGQQNIMPGQGQQNIMPGQGQQNIMPGQGQQNIMLGQGQQNIMPGQGQQNIMPGQGQQNIMQVPGGGMPVLVPEPLPPNDGASSDGRLSPVGIVQETPMIKENLQPQGDAMPKIKSDDSAKENSLQDERVATEAPVNKILQDRVFTLAPNLSTPISEGQTGHDAAQPVSQDFPMFDTAQPVSQDLRVLGYPLWLVITVGLALFVALILFVVAICLCCRRRCRNKSAEANKEIEKMPAPLERVCSIGIPPPAYNTAILQQNDDGLELPPLDMKDADNADDTKIPLDDEADDESDETDDKKSEEKRN